MSFHPDTFFAIVCLIINYTWWKMSDSNSYTNNSVFKVWLDWILFIAPYLLNIKILHKVENILKGSLDSIPSPSVKIRIMGGKVCFRCRGKTLLGDVDKHFVFKSFALLPQVNTPANNLKFGFLLKVMGLNPGYLLKSFLL